MHTLMELLAVVGLILGIILIAIGIGGIVNSLRNRGD